MSIAVLTTVHPRTDVRILVKQVSTLASRLDTQVTFYVQDGQGNQRDPERHIDVVDTGPLRGGRLTRMTKGAWRMYRTVRPTRPRIAHFHDPELIPVGVLLKLSGIKVIYDVHEDLPRQIMGKYWINPILRRTVAVLAEAMEWIAARTFDGLVTATPTISARFPADKTITVQNFPLYSEFCSQIERAYCDRPLHFAYIGALGRLRGSKEMVEAVNELSMGPVKLEIAGKFFNLSDEREAHSLNGWKHVRFYGWADRVAVGEILSRARAGLVTLHPTSSYRDAYPVKMFEYMAAGLPVIASDFPLWRSIVEGANCGLLVDPLNPKEIAQAMQWILDHPNEAEEMGRRGRQAVRETYSWESEADKLLQFYHRFLDDA